MSFLTEKRAFYREASKALEARLRHPGAPPRPRRRVDHVLVGDITVGQARTALDDLAEGAGRELRLGKGGSPPFCSAESSAALALNSFAAFLGRTYSDQHLGLRIADPRFERTYPVRGVRARGVPTADVSIDSQRAVVVESKLLEPWRSEPKVSFSPQYDAVAKRISPGTLETMNALRSRHVKYQVLDAAQLLKHLYGIHSAINSGKLPAKTELLLLYWEPGRTGSRGKKLFDKLDDEFRDLKTRLSDQTVPLRSMSYRSLWRRWLRDDNPAWLRSHARALVDRYSVSL